MSFPVDSLNSVFLLVFSITPRPPVSTLAFPSSVSLPGCGGGTNELSRQEEKMKRVGGGWGGFLLNALVHMKEEEEFILGLSRGRAHGFETHSHSAVCARVSTGSRHTRTLSGEARAHKPRDEPDLPFSISLLLRAARRTLSV